MVAQKVVVNGVVPQDSWVTIANNGDSDEGMPVARMSLLL